MKNPDEINYSKIIDDYFAQNKPPSLYDKFYDWLNNENLCQSRDVIANELVNIVKDFLPKEHDTNDYHWNKCLKTINDHMYTK